MHLVLKHKGMLSKPEILVWALKEALWGPCLPGTCWGLELWGTYRFESSCPELGECHLQLSEPCGDSRHLHVKILKDQGHLRQSPGGQVIGSLPTHKFPSYHCLLDKGRVSCNHISGGGGKWFCLEVTFLRGCRDACSCCFLFLVNKTMLPLCPLFLTLVLQCVCYSLSLENQIYNDVFFCF